MDDANAGRRGFEFEVEGGKIDRNSVTEFQNSRKANSIFLVGVRFPRG